MKSFQGIAVSPGIAISQAFVLAAEGVRIPLQYVQGNALDAEVARFKKAVAEAQEEVIASRDSITDAIGRKYGDIFEAHFQILNDPKLILEIESLIREFRHTAEYAVSETMHKYVAIFRGHDNSYLAARGNDILDIEKRLLQLLLGVRRERLRKLDNPIALLASDLTPSETANLDVDIVKGFATEQGGPGGHTAIIAAALGLPAVVGVGPFLNEVVDGDMIIIDGENGEVIAQPDEETLNRYRRKIEAAQSLAIRLSDSLADQEARTHDRIRVQLLANIEFPFEAPQCFQRGADGIGLFRTEFLYLLQGRDRYVSEEDHFHVYKTVAEAVQGRPITIRTYDLGADKVLDSPTSFDPSSEGKNPALGLRSIRLSLRNVDMFRLQLRAILRASVYGKIRIMFPLIATILELRQAKMILADVKDELLEEGIPFHHAIHVGMMLEVPAAILMIERFVKEVDFFSIGTNDLIQYTLAVDRSNRDVNHLFNSEDPAVLYLVKYAISVANNNGVPISLCGQMSSNPLYTMLLLGLGLRQFSCAPASLTEIKRICGLVEIPECERIADAVMEMESARDIRSFLREKFREVLSAARKAESPDSAFDSEYEMR
ncbi:MAG TPA: phosphoenolpyruvate--protein phosphotransferase [Planctomycetaceae bacterium]|nr:phosphoenolpyruvate--protein phosphotransferase [Planctomycetaceae bacterium]